MEPGRTRIAILEDQLLMRLSLRELLERGGFEVVGECADLPSFLSQVALCRPNVAIVDLLVDPFGGGASDGLEVVKQLRQLHPETKVIVFSGTTDTALSSRAFQEGAFAFLHKLSTNAEILLKVIRSVVEGRVVPSLPPTRSPLSPLQNISKREREVLSYLASGADNLKIATHLGISERTVRAHVSSLYRKLGSENRTHLALLALQLGLRPPPDV